MENEKDGGDLPEQNRPRQRQMDEANGKGDEFIEDGGLKLQAEEIRIMREQDGVQISLDGRQIKRVVLKARVIAHYQHGPHSECGQQRQVRGGGIASAWHGWNGCATRKRTSQQFVYRAH